MVGYRFWNVGTEKPNMAIIARVHGNEGGLEALENVSTYPISTGSSYFIEANVGAAKRGKRFLEEDLNRVWELEGFYDNSKSIVHERKLAYMLYHNLLNGIGKTLSIHTTTGSTPPMIISPEINPLIHTVPIENVVIYGDRGRYSASMNNFLTKMGKDAITIECHKQTAIEEIEAWVERFLVENGMRFEDRKVDLTPVEKKYFCITGTVGLKEAMEYPDVKNFETIGKGDEVAIFAGEKAYELEGIGFLTARPMDI
jgi:hypothetical protein